MSQSIAIARFLANRFNLAGRDDVTKAEADEVIDTLEDVQTCLYSVHFAAKEDKKKKLEEALPKLSPILQNLEKRISARGGQFMAGNSLTWADLHCYQVIVVNFFKTQY